MKRVLVIDDNADNRYSLRLLLDGFEVLEAAGGEEGIELARTRHPDCILLDVQMPGMDGFEVCRRLRGAEETRSIPIILVTAHHRDTQSVVRGLAAGGDDYVTKPVAQQELLARVRAMLRIRELQDDLERLNLDLEREVRRRTQELRQIYETVPVGIYTLDATGHLTSMNRHMEEMVGYTEEEVVGKRSIGELFVDDYDTLYWLELCRREGRAACEGLACCKNGERFPVFDERVVMLDEVGEHIGFTGCMQDLRQRRRIQELLKAQEKQAGVGRLASGIVHEIANPLTGVAQYMDAMARRLDRGDAIPKDEMRRGAEVMGDALRRTTDLIQHLRGLTRPAVRTVMIVDPRILLDDLHALMRYDLHRRGIEMRVRGVEGKASVEADAGRISQVFLNLITNARDAMPDGGAIDVEVAAEDSTVQVRFKDSGCGIAPEDLERVFDFLFTTKGEAGTGYGLTICRDIVADHGGRIEVESEVGRGSTFTVVLPRRASGPPVAMESET